MDKKQVLKEFGLTDKEVDVYLALLSLGSALVQDIAKKAGTYRTYTYEILKSLMNKGIVSYVIKSGKQYFEVAPPDTLVSILKEKEQKINNILSELKTSYKSSGDKPNVEVYEGREGMKTIFQDILNEGKEIYNLASGKNLFSILEFEFPHFIKARIKKKIPIKIITNKTNETLKHKKEGKKAYRDIRFMPKDKSITNATFIYGNKVSIISFDKGFTGIIISNEEIARNHRIVFDMLWEISKK